MDDMGVTGRRADMGRSVLVVLMLGYALIAASAQTDDAAIRNSFTPEGEVRLGQEAAALVRGALPLLRDREVQRFVGGVGRRLVNAIPADVRQPRFRYSFEIQLPSHTVRTAASCTSSAGRPSLRLVSIGVPSTGFGDPFSSSIDSYVSRLAILSGAELNGLIEPAARANLAATRREASSRATPRA